MAQQDLVPLPILIIDDVDSARAVLADMLRELGFSSFLEARNGREALDILSRHSVRMIFCDHIMEEMTGLEFLHSLKHLDADVKVPVIFVSAVGEVSTVEDAIELGAADYLVKPISFRKLRRKVEEALHSRGPAVPSTYEIGF